MKARAVALYSGGLDSILAVRMIQEQDIDVLALHNKLDVHSEKISEGEESEVERSARRLGVPLEVIYDPDGFLQILKNPRHGYGRNMNPCIDCRIYLLRKAADYMKQMDAQFIITGEVLGERPMSQNRQSMNLIEKESGLDRLILRPLSAKLMEVTIPEERGLVDREKLMAIQGRSRKPQMALARKYGITEYPSPAGGCLLTDPGYARRLADLMQNEPGFGSNDMNMLKAGRHFRLAPNVRFVVGRNHAENQTIIGLARRGDILMKARDFTGPITLYRGADDEKLIKIAAAATARYGHGKDQPEVAISWTRIAEEGAPAVFGSDALTVKPESPDESGATRIE